MIKGTKCR